MSEFRQYASLPRRSDCPFELVAIDGNARIRKQNGYDLVSHIPVLI
jgi:hypothetical protein